MARTGACLAQLWLNSTSVPRILRKVSPSPLVPTTNAHGCSLLLEGAQRAASNKLWRISGETAFSEKARGLQRSRINSWTGCCVAADFCIYFLLRISKAEVAAGGAFSPPVVILQSSPLLP